MRDRQKPGASDILLLIDLRYDFMPGGALAVAEGDAVVPLVNRLAGVFRQVVFTQDWRPRGHVSFASGHPGAKPFETVRVAYGEQTLWPDHCVQGDRGARLHRDPALDRAGLILRKGANVDIDSYSAFVEADGATRTGLAGCLRERAIDRVFVAGLATDYCVAFSALDAQAAGFKTLVIEDACRAIDLAGSLAAAWRKMSEVGVERIDSAVLLA